MLKYTTLSKQLQFNPRTPYHKIPPGSGADNTAAPRLITWSYGNTRHRTTSGSRNMSSDLTTLPRTPARILTCNRQNAAFQRPSGHGEKLNFRRIVYSIKKLRERQVGIKSHFTCALCWPNSSGQVCNLRPEVQLPYPATPAERTRWYTGTQRACAGFKHTTCQELPSLSLNQSCFFHKSRVPCDFLSTRQSKNPISLQRTQEFESPI